MKKVTTELGFIDRILESLEAMGSVSLEENHLVKSNIKFAKIIDSSVSFINKQGVFNEADENILEDEDKLFTEATKAYWIASGKT